MADWVYYVGRLPVLLFFLLFARVRVRGKENVPKKGGLLVSANHVNLMDPIVVAAAVGRPCAFMAKEELFRSWLGGRFVSILGAFPVRRGSFDRTALRRASEVLAERKALIMFPEGARTTSGGHRPEGFLGAAMIASRSEVPILPVAVSGTSTIEGWRWMLRRPRITVHIGRPFNLSSADGAGRRQELEAQTREIMAHIHSLLPDLPREEAL